MNWKEEAVKYLHQSLYLFKTELNELDWKSQHSLTKPKAALLHQGIKHYPCHTEYEQFQKQRV